MGLGLFEEFKRTIQDLRDRLDTTLDELRSACLLQDGGDDKENVTIHDLYSEVVVSTPFRGQNSLMMNSNYGWPKEKLEKCWAICQDNVGSDRLAKLMMCGFPNLKILMLSQPEDWLGRLAHRHDEGDFCRLDFTYMKELRVLYLRSRDITSLPSSIGILGNLHSLYLDHCDIKDVAILGKLKALQILYFTKSEISRLPKEIGELTNLRLLNLSNCYRLEIIEPGVLKRLINLEELRMKGSFDRWMGKDEIPSESCNARLAELKSWKKLTALEISIPDPTILLEDGDLPFGNLVRFWINIGNVDGREFEGLRTMKLKLKGCDSILSKEWVQKTLLKTQYLHLDGLREFKQNAHGLCIRGFPQLKHLDIQNNPSIKYIASLSDGLPLTAFTILESLFIENLINLEKICHGPVAPRCFSKLKAVSVTTCDRLKSLWCFSEMQRLIQLEEIEVWGCQSMQAIVIDDAREDIVSTDDLIEFPNVRRLKLGELPNMTSFCSGARITSEGALIQVSLPSLEELKLGSVGSFNRIWYGGLLRSSFCKLATLTLSSCSDLLNVFPSTIIGRLHNLKEVQITWCHSLKSVFDCGSLDSNTEQTRVLLPYLESVFVGDCHSLESLFDCGSFDSNTERKIVLLPKLEEVRVSGARALRHVVKSDSQIVLGFPRLKEVFVDNCSKLRYLFPNCTATTLEELTSLWISKCEQMEEVVPKEEGGRSKADVMSFLSLRHLSILGCHNFGAFIPSPTSVKRQLGETTEENDESPQPLFNEMVTFPNIRFLQIKGVQCKELWNNQIPNDSFCKLESLELKDCDSLQHIAPSHMWKRLQHCLEILKVISCRSIEIIYESDGTDTKSGKLRNLYLLNLENLRHIWQCDGLPNVPFPKLRSIKAKRCSCLQMLFPTFTVEFLGQIEMLEVRHCENMELIAAYGECEEATGMTITFSKLTELYLENLPKFRSYLPEKYSSKLPPMERLYVHGCGTERNQGIDKYWPSPYNSDEEYVRNTI